MRNKIKNHTGWLIVLAFTLLYLIFPNNNQGYDSYSYAISAKEGADLFHPHHLIYNLFGYALFSLLSFTGLGSMKILSLANTVFGVLSLRFVYDILSKRSGYFESLAGTVLTGSLFSFWYYSTSAEVNMPAIFFTIVALYFLVAKDEHPASGWLVYLLMLIGVLFHQLVALIGIPVLLYDMRRSGSATAALKRAHPGILLGALIYTVVAIENAAEKNAAGMLKWITQYGHAGEWGKLGTANISQGVWGKIKTVFGGEIIREIFYGGQWRTFSIIYIAIIAIIYLGLTYLFIISCVRLYKNRDRISALYLVLIVSLSLFAGWWAPHDDGFWLYPFVILGLFIFGMPFRSKVNRVIAGVTIAILLMLNISCEFISSSDKSNSLIYEGAMSFRRLELTSNDLVITNLSQSRLAYEYYTGVHVPTTCMMFLPLGDKDSVIEGYHRRISEAKDTARVYMFEDEIYPDDYRGYLFGRFTAEEYSNTYERYYPHLMAADSVYMHGRYVRIYQLKDDNPIGSIE